MEIKRTQKNKQEEYQAELANAMGQLKRNLSECQTIMGIIESFLYLSRKESENKEIENEAPYPNNNGKEG